MRATYCAWTTHPSRDNIFKEPVPCAAYVYNKRRKDFLLRTHPSTRMQLRRSRRTEMANPRVPTEIKKARGTDQPCRRVKNEAQPEVGTCCRKSSWQRTTQHWI